MPLLQAQEVRRYLGIRIDGERTVDERVKAYRLGLVGPMRYGAIAVPVVPCRQCGERHPDDGTPCAICGVYQYWDSTQVATLDGSKRTWVMLVEFQGSA